MAFQINEKMMAQDRAIITRNKIEQDLVRTDDVKFKPGMAHYVSENQKLWLSVEPKKITTNGVDKIRNFLEVITDVRLSTILLDYVNRDGGANNSMRGPLHSIVATGATPMVIASTTKVNNLNVDRVDDMHVDANATGSTIVGRDSSGNAKLNTKLMFAGAYIRNNVNELHLNSTADGIYAATKTGKLTVEGGELKLNNTTSTSGISITTADTTKVARLAFNNTSRVWECGLEGSLSEIVTKSLYGHGKGIDADTVDQKHVDDTKTDTSSLWTSNQVVKSRAPRGFGIGTDHDLIPNNDCNAIIGTGMFSSVGTPVNGATGETGEALIQQYISQNGAYQEIEYLDSKNIYSRIKANGAWTSWTKTMTKDNIFDEGINIITQAAQPTNITNNNTYWYEII